MKNPENPPDYFLDISADVCPMTFVKTRLSIEKMSAGQILEVRLKGEEPRKNVPDSLTELGHVVLSMVPETPDDDGPDAVFRLFVRKI